MTELSGELRPAYRTLNEPTRLLGLSIGAWLAIVAAAGVAYGWLLVSPFDWRANVSVAVIGLGAPLALLALREQTTVSPGRLLAAVVLWRLRAATIIGLPDTQPVSRGAVRLDSPAPRDADV